MEVTEEHNVWQRTDAHENTGRKKKVSRKILLGEYEDPNAVYGFVLLQRIII